MATTANGAASAQEPNPLWAEIELMLADYPGPRHDVGIRDVGAFRDLPCEVFLDIARKLPADLLNERVNSRPTTHAVATALANVPRATLRGQFEVYTDDAASFTVTAVRVADPDITDAVWLMELGLAWQPDDFSSAHDEMWMRWT